MAIDPLSAARAYQQAARSAQAGAGTQGGDAVDFGSLVQEAVRQAGQSAQAAEQQALAVAAGRADIVDVLLRGYLALLRIKKAQGDLDSAQALLQDVEPVIQRMGIPLVKEWVNALQAQVWLEKGDTQAAFRWAAGVSGNVHDVIYPAIPVTLAQVLLVQGRPDDALQLLDHALQAAEQVGRLGNAIQILVVRSLAHRARGDPDRALVAEAMVVMAVFLQRETLSSSGAPFSERVGEQVNIRIASVSA